MRPARIGPRPTLVVNVLGSFQVAIAGRPVRPQEWGHGSAQRLFKLLIVSGRHRLRREAAAELLWPGAAPGRGATNVRRAIHYLNRLFQRVSLEHPLVRDGSVIGLDIGISTASDLEALQRCLDRLERSLADNRDVIAEVDALLAIPEIELLPDDAAEEWLVAARDRLLMRWEALLLHAASVLANSGDTVRASAGTRRILAADPANEDAHRLAIELFIRAGQRHAARRQLELCRRSLIDTYGIEPAQATIEAMGSPSLLGRGAIGEVRTGARA